MENNQKSEISNSSLNENNGWTDILGSGEIMKKVLKPGHTDVKPETHDLCIVSYDAYIENGLCVDSQHDVSIHLGDLELVYGLDLAIALMETGEQSEIIIGHRFAYGTKGLEPLIPPKERMKYIIELKEIVIEPNLSNIPVPHRLKIGNIKKDRGNWWFAREQFSFAIICYRRALEYYDVTEYPPDTEELQQLVSDVKLKVHNNLAAAQMKIKAYSGAFISLDYVLKCQPDNVKALWRKSMIHKELGNIDDCLKIIKQALFFDPTSKSLNQELNLLLSLKRERNDQQKRLFRRMLGNSISREECLKRKLPERAQKKSKSDDDKEQWRWKALVVATAITCTIAGAIVAIKYHKV